MNKKRSKNKGTVNEGNTGTTANLFNRSALNINIMEYLYFLALQVELLTTCETQKKSIYTAV